jgi:proline dehydrogenase
MVQGQKFGVRVIVDAEQSWYQPAIDVYTEELMREFNAGRGPPIVCASFPAYLRR